MKRFVTAALLLLMARAAFASGGGLTLPFTIDPYGGSAAEQAAFYNGRVGIIMGRAPWSRLFAAWRILHGLKVGAEAGKTLAEPCCGGGWGSSLTATKAWIAERSTVPGVVPIMNDWIETHRDVGDFAWVQTCFPDAFDTAARTLTARVAAYGAADPWVRVWVAGQDAVFASCAGKSAVPALDAAAPAWLVADTAYQNAAVALYTRDFALAGAQFEAIAADAASPWRMMAPYLAVRAAVSAALPTKDPAAFALARQRLAALAPDDAYGHVDMARLEGALGFRDQPDKRRGELAATLTAPALAANVAADFKDSRRLGQAPLGEPAYLDWIAVFGRAPDKPEAPWFDHYDADQVWKTDADALAHARARWTETSDPAWLIAAMEWSNPGTAADDLVAASGRLPADSPAYLTALYHRVRLTAAPASARDALDAALARTDLSMTDRNLLTAERTLAAADLQAFARMAPRDTPCVAIDDSTNSCVGDDFGMEWVIPVAMPHALRFGEEAAAVADRLPLAERTSLAEMPGLPAPLGLDVGFTSWVRAVLAMDYTIADRLAGRLRVQLPQLEAEWAAYLGARPGDDKRFAAWFILAKVPGADVNLLGEYTRPEGKVADFDGHWKDWLYAPAGAAPVEAARIETDVICYGMCGPGGFPFRLPPFAAAAADKAAAERGRFSPADAKKAGSVWDDVMAYARAHPADPRSPEALYWLVRVSRFGTGHNRSSYRAWVLLHDRYKTSVWAKNSKYFYD